MGRGILAIAVTNALNEEYYTPDSWRYANSAYFSQGQGATMRMTYTMTY